MQESGSSPSTEEVDVDVVQGAPGTTAETVDGESVEEEAFCLDDLPGVLSKKEQRAAAKTLKGGRRKKSDEVKSIPDNEHWASAENPLSLLVIGAGPHSLSLCLRLIEPSADMLHDGERILEGLHTRAGVWSASKLHVQSLRRGSVAQLRVSAERAAINEINLGLNSTYSAFERTPHVPLSEFKSHCAVVDAHGDWMREWDKNFDAYEIKYLRSSVYVHPDPHDQRALSSYADLYKRENEQRAFSYVTRGCDANPANDGYHGPFKAPGTQMFADFVRELIKGYGLDGIVRKGRAQSMKWDHSCGIFRVHVDGRELCARRVVCALGPNLREEPLFFEHSVGPHPADRMVHASGITDWLLGMRERGGWENEGKGWRVLVVGGGLTSAHLVNVALNHGASHVTLATRSQLRRRQFDIEAKWVGPSRGDLLKEFYKKPPRGRAKMNAEARGGGSMPDEAFDELERWVEEGKCEIKRETEVSKAVWSEGAEAGGGEWHVDLATGTGGESLHCDVMWLSTGGVIEIDQYPLLKSMMASWPIEVVTGLPVLRDDLSWGEGCPMYVMGALAQLQLGPDALNLAGGRHGATRIATVIRKEMAAAREQEKQGGSVGVN